MKGLVCLTMVAALAACGDSSPTYRMYRSGPTGEALIHMATFDRDTRGMEIPNFNRDNCRWAARVMRKASETKAAREAKEPAKFWCEEGSVREDVE